MKSSVAEIVTLVRVPTVGEIIKCNLEKVSNVKVITYNMCACKFYTIIELLFIICFFKPSYQQTAYMFKHNNQTVKGLRNIGWMLIFTPITLLTFNSTMFCDHLRVTSFY